MLIFLRDSYGLKTHWHVSKYVTHIVKKEKEEEDK